MKRIVPILFLLFSIMGFSQTVPVAKINDYLNQTKKQYDLTSQDIQEWELMSEGNSEATKMNYYYIVQKYNGIQIFNTFSNALYRDGKIVNIHNSFISNIASKVNTTVPSISAIEAFNAANTLMGAPAVNTEVLENTANMKFKLKNGALDNDPVTANLVFQPTEDGKLRLSWDLSYYSQDYSHLWSIRIDALNGKILQKNDLVINCTFGTPDHNNHNHSKAGYNFTNFAFKNEPANQPMEILGGKYRVIPYNYTSPNHSPFQLITDPENATASPKGWHDANSLAGNLPVYKYTVTRGNNVLASADYTNTNPTGVSSNPDSDGYAPDGGAALNFDFPYGGTGVAAKTYINAAATNLFYMNNVLHDVWFQYGFDEANGNFQRANYTGTANGNDFVYANAQDGSLSATPTLNNANFGTPTDGNNPRMQMFLWNIGPVPKYLTVNSPAAVAGNYVANNNVFNPGNAPLPNAPGLTSNLVLYNDGGNSEACVAALNPTEINGKIVLIRRGNCPFTEKVKNAQNAGASAVIIMNNVPNALVNMSGADATITIPAIFITQELGDALIAQMSGGPVNVKIQNENTGFVNTDGDFDNVIISHEYGHGISNRLAGGRLNSSCLNSYESMGEGWSDWFALMMQLKPGDLATDPKTVGTFVVSEPNNGPGIRQYPYTTNMSVNPKTFVNTNTPIPTDPANTGYRYVIGEFWATVLWDLTWAYIDKYGYNNNIYTGTGGNNKVMRLVLDGLKGQPCNPGIVAGRDALLAADLATTGGADNCLIWQVFARRGVGFNASSGNNNDCNDQVQDFSLPSSCALNTSGFNYDRNLKVYPNPVTSNLTIELNDYNGGVVKVTLFDINGRSILSTSLDNSSSTNQINISNLQNGVYFLKLDSDTISTTRKIIKN